VSPPPTILCVDDEQAVLNQLSALLARAFGDAHRIECAQSAEEALSLIEEAFAAGGSVALVICDQVMPGMKGDRFLEIIHRMHPEVMKVLLTGQAGLDSAIYAINNAGLHRYFEKPWEAADLTRTVETLLAQHRLRAELDRQNARLAAAGRELRELHQVALRIASAGERSRVLALVCEAAQRISPRGALYARAGRGDPAHWWLLPPDGVEPEARRAIETALAAGLAQPAGLPEGQRAQPLRHGEALFGWLLHPDSPAGDEAELLSILSSQAATALANLELQEERLEGERLSAVGRMLGGIVHDFRNPMTAIKGYAGMFEDGALAPEKRREFARLIVDEADRMSAMAEEVLEFARGGSVQLQLTSVPVTEIVGMLQRLLAPELAERRVTLSRDLRYTGQVEVDLDRLKRALLNIANNALDAMEAGGTLSLTSRLVDGQLELTLADTGHGIPEDLLPRLFEPFFTHGKPHGMGLGMAISRRIVEEHGGRIEVDSRPGRGTAVALLLPLRHGAGH
jgi:two-component system chemotaxis response regulator CheY